MRGSLKLFFDRGGQGRRIISTYMSTHEKSQIDCVLEVLAKLAKKHRIRFCDLGQLGSFLEGAGYSGDYAAAPGSAVGMGSD